MKISCVHDIFSFHGIGVMKFFMKISYSASIHCMT